MTNGLILYGWESKGVYRNKSRGRQDMREAQGGGGQNLNRKFKTLGFLDTLKVHIQSNYLTDTTFSP